MLNRTSSPLFGFCTWSGDLYAQKKCSYIHTVQVIINVFWKRSDACVYHIYIYIHILHTDGLFIHLYIYIHIYYICVRAETISSYLFRKLDSHTSNMLSASWRNHSGNCPNLKEVRMLRVEILKGLHNDVRDGPQMVRSSTSWCNGGKTNQLELEFGELHNQLQFAELWDLSFKRPLM